MMESVRLSWDKREKQFYKGLEEYFFEEEEDVEKTCITCKFCGRRNSDIYCRWGYDNDCKLPKIYNLIKKIDSEVIDCPTWEEKKIEKTCGTCGYFTKMKDGKGWCDWNMYNTAPKCHQGLSTRIKNNFIGCRTWKGRI